MRIAVSGAHGTGKTTLVEELFRMLPGYATVAEPYVLLAEEGQAFPDAPALQDFEDQLDRSIIEVEQSADDTLFDRCPADILTYITTHSDSSAVDRDRWLSRTQASMGRLDLVVYVPIEEPDRIDAGDEPGHGWRQRVDEEIREMLLGGRLGIDVAALEVTGTPDERAVQVLARLASMQAGRL